MSEFESRDEDYNFNSDDEEIIISEGDYVDDIDEEKDDSGDDKTSDYESVDGNNDILSVVIIKV